MAGTLEQKLDKILVAVSILTKRVDDFDKTLSSFGTRLDEIERKFNTKIEDLNNRVNSKADTSEIENLRSRIVCLENINKQLEANAVMKESYEKRFNILIHGIPENQESAWETPVQTLDHIQKFLTDGLKISDPSSIPLVDYHRLPQKPVYKNDHKINRPIIIKVTNASDKRRIFNNLTKLKSYNAKRRELNLGTVYVTEHLPKLFQEERKLLLPFFKKAKFMKQKTAWKAENGHYHLLIDDIKVELPLLDN